MHKLTNLKPELHEVLMERLKLMLRITHMNKHMQMSFQMKRHMTLCANNATQINVQNDNQFHSPTSISASHPKKIKIRHETPKLKLKRKMVIDTNAASETLQINGENRKWDKKEKERSSITTVTKTAGKEAIPCHGLRRRSRRIE